MQVEPSPPPSPKGQANSKQEKESQQKKAAKPKKPKVKRFGTAEVAARIDADELSRVLEGIEQKYRTDEGIQLEIFTDHFIALFKEADIPFNNNITELSQSKVNYFAQSTFVGPTVCMFTVCSI